MAFKDIRRSRKWLSAEEVRFLVLLGLALAVVIALNLYLARTLPGGELFFQRWSGARTYLSGQVEPYSATIAERVQQIAYGRAAFSSEYPYVLNDPFPIVLLYVPMALISDFVIARGLWMLISEILLVATVFYFLRLLEWEPPRWLYGCILVFSVLGYFSLIAVGSGTQAIVFTFFYVLILNALRSFSDELAGALLFLIAYQWEVNALFFLFIVVFVFVNRRWRVLSGFGMSLFLLIAISLLAYPGWGLPYVRGVLSDWYRGVELTFGHIISFWFPESRLPIGLWTAVGLGAIVLAEWVGAVNSHVRRIAWTASLSLAVTPLMGFAIFPSNHVVLLPAFILILMLVWERWTRRRVWFTLIVFLSAFLVPFALYVGVNRDYNPLLLSDLLTVLPPVATVIGLYWMRWWAVRSPRTWFDQLEIRK
ncbi:MAG: hypothetical protein C3F07_01165 [Anaerolineales bacterium]|nr:MAG: hypothetical protein C3F07_01165 [Anaerolineales bacterium]